MDRRVFWTERGYMGLAANGIQVGDEIWVINAANVPFIVRQSTLIYGKQLHHLVCEAYFHGIMDGKALGFSNIVDGYLALE